MTRRTLATAPKTLTRWICLAVLALAPFVRADIVETIDQGTLSGTVTLAAGDAELTLTDERGNAQRFNTIDINTIRFNVDLATKGSGQQLLIDNDQGSPNSYKSETIKLRKGLHRFTLPYWQAAGEHKLQVFVAGPGIDGRRELYAEMLRCFRDIDETADASDGIDEQGFRLPELSFAKAEDRRLMLSRARYRLSIGEEGQAPGSVTDLAQLRLKRSGTSSAVNTGMLNEQNTNVGLVFDAFFLAEQDGEYTFSLLSDDGSQLYFGQVDTFSSSTLGNTPLHAPWRIELAHDGIARGELKTIADESMTLHVPLVSDMTIALSHIRAAWDKTLDLDTLNRDNEPGNQDTVYLRDKNDAEQIRSVSGQVTAMDDVSLKFVFRGKERMITRDRVVGLVFRHDSRAVPEKLGMHQVLELQGGQVFPCRVISIGKHVTFNLFGGGQATPPREAVRAMRIENGRRIDLTRVTPNAEEAIPYFGLKLPHQINTNFSGQPIVLFDDKVYPAGLAVHSKSRLHYKLKPNSERFQATFGLLKPGGKLGDVTARVIGDGAVLWEQPNITGTTGSVDVNVALNGIERLILEVDFGEGQNVGDRAAWCNPRLIYASEDQP